MPGQEVTHQPLFFVLAVISAVLTVGFYIGNSLNKKLFEKIYDELAQVINPEKKEYGNIGGSKEYYCDFSMPKASPLEKIDVKFTLLPRHIWPYLPLAMLLDKYDKLLMAMHFKQKLRDEGHLIEVKYAKFSTVKIANSDQLNKTFIKWGGHDFHIYYRGKKTYERFLELIDKKGDPGVIRHVALVPGQKKCFVFMIPRKGQIVKDLPPVYNWLLSLD